MKSLYIVDYWVPFPQSEYGGLWVVIAENEDECFDLIAQADNGFNRPHYVQLRKNVEKSSYFALAESVESRIVEEFTT